MDEVIDDERLEEVPPPGRDGHDELIGLDDDAASGDDLAWAEWLRQRGDEP